MRKILIGLTAVAMISGCTSDWDRGKAAVIVNESAKPAGVDQKARTTAERLGAPGARLPDRGSLIVYDRTQASVRRAAFTYHPVELSETHALNAAHPGGKIELQTPAGKTMSLAYNRHVEHGDGNWTWVGRTQEGLDAVITFGAEAVVGRIAQTGTEALQLKSSDSRIWLIEADPSKLRHPGSSLALDHDVAIIPQAALESAQAKAAAKSATAANAPDAVSAATGPNNTVDVVLGYTPGLVTQLGSTSIVVTTLTNRIELTNQALAASLVTPRVRLVRTLQVNYTDGNSNSAALDALSGQTCTTTSCTTIPVPAELQPLRNARDQFGGDIVSLVRPLKEPEHLGCGIAWLLGPNNSTIDSTDAPFAYSVVSNGSDVRESDGFTYSCPVETLAHEMAHNMGQQHNVEDSGGDAGTHPYSYGFREASLSGFYTIMAYPAANSSQFSILNYANPNVNYLTGRPTGTATADNARSLNQSMLLVAQFRNAVVPFAGRPRNDINGDGTSDLLWHNGGALSFWQMTNGNVTSTGGQVTPATYLQIATGDFDGNGVTDLLWRDRGNLRVWLKSATGGFSEAGLGSYPVGWQLVGSGDVNGDSRDDLVWQQGATVATWLMNGAAFSAAGASISVPAGATAVVMGDFTCDGRADILWRNAGNELAVWRSGGGTSTVTFTAQIIAAFPNGWASRGSGDFNGDGCQDLAWFNGSVLSYWLLTADTNGTVSISGTGGRAIPAGATLISLLDVTGNSQVDAIVRLASGGLSVLSNFGTSTTEQAISTYPTGWLAIDGQRPYVWVRSITRDINGDMRSDIGWANGSTYSFWTMYGNNVQTIGGQSYPTNRTAVGRGDFDGDLLEDVLWRSTAGELIRWRRTLTGYVDEPIGSYPTGWIIAGTGDIDGDGKSDIVWQNGVNYSYWLMEGSTVKMIGGQSLPSTYTALAMGDLDGDGRADLLWRASDNQMYVGKSAGLSFNNVAIGIFPTGWTLLGVGDVDGDSANDLMWHNGSGVFTHWKMIGLAPSPQPGQPMPLTGDVIAIGDYTGDGKSDLIWRTSSNALTLAIPDGSPTQASSIFAIGSYPSGWTLIH
jgi:peptidyl-Asp metalloendopeptidase